MVTKNREPSFDLTAVQEMLHPCIQCGTCTASCPNEFAMDVTPRRLWRMVLMNRAGAVFDTKTFILCSSCYSCSLRCPRGLPLTDAMAALKQMASHQVPRRFHSSTAFYSEFLASVRRHGRVREMEMMTMYFIRMKQPMLPLRFAGLGLKCISKGLVPIQLPTRGSGKLNVLFNTVEEMERPS